MANQIQNKQAGRYQPYPEYIDSGVEWLGKIPSHWQIIRLKYLCDIATGDKDTVDARPDGKYPFFVRSKNIERINTYSYDGEAILTAGDGDIGKIFHYIRGKFDFHQRVYRFSSFKKIKGLYLYYYMSNFLAYEVLKLSAKTTVDSLRLPFLQNFPVVLSNINTQTQIAQFLDYETAKIDLLIEKQQKLIELLKEKRQAVISHAVTKGLDPNVEMKDSGVEWLGEVPAHWEVLPIKYLFKIINGATPKSGNSTFWDGNIKWATPSDFSNKKGDYLLHTKRTITSAGYESCGTTLIPSNSIILSTRAPIGSLAISATPMCTNQGCKSLIEMRKNTIIKFYYYFLLSQTRQLNLFGRGTTFLELSTEDLASFCTINPTYKEQSQIAEYLDTQTSKIDLLIEKAEAQIALMQERRTALISAAVTGKIDLRHWQMPEVSDHQGGDNE